MPDRQTLLDRMRGAYGKSQAGARIWIEDFQLRSVHDGVAVVTYVEWQEVGGQKRGRLSTAVLRAAALSQISMQTLPTWRWPVM